jgi:hypothetical protein
MDAKPAMCQRGPSHHNTSKFGKLAAAPPGNHPHSFDGLLDLLFQLPDHPEVVCNPYIRAARYRGHPRRKPLAGNQPQAQQGNLRDGEALEVKRKLSFSWEKPKVENLSAVTDRLSSEVAVGNYRNQAT